MNKVGKTFILVLISLWYLKVGAFLLQSPAAQQDFKTYYFAVKAWNAGVNPYSIDELSRISGTKINVPFLYSPISLPFFEPFIFFPYKTAAVLFFFVKAFLLIGLFILWIKGFLWDHYDVLFIPFCLLAFNSTLYIDFRAGNISVIEQFFLWLGFYFFLRRQWVIFILFILLTSCFKIIPIVFLGLLFFSENRRKLEYLAGGIGIFLTIHAGVYLVSPDLFQSFVRQILEIKGESGIINPSVFAFIGEGVITLSKNTGIGFSHIVHFILYAVVAAGVISGFLWGARLLKDHSDRDRLLVFLPVLPIP